MVEHSEDFDHLMRRLREGSEDPARILFDRYGRHIRRVVRRKLNKKIRSKFDSDDFTQAVWASFFAKAPSKYAFDSPEELIAFLASIAQHKVVDAFRQRVLTEKYNIDREHSLDSSTVYRDGYPASRAPTPSQVASAHEQWDMLVDGQPAHYRGILDMLRQGHTHIEIAETLGLNEKTVRRLIQKLEPGTGP